METSQAVKMIGRLLRGNSEAAAKWIMQTGLTEAQTLALGEAIAANKLFQPPRHQPKEKRGLCPQCGEHFTYMQVTTPRKYCSEECLNAAHNRYRSLRNEKQWLLRGCPAPKRPKRYISKYMKAFYHLRDIAHELGYKSHHDLPSGISLTELEAKVEEKRRNNPPIVLTRKKKPFPLKPIQEPSWVPLFNQVFEDPTRWKGRKSEWE